MERLSWHGTCERTGGDVILKIVILKIVSAGEVNRHEVNPSLSVQFGCAWVADLWGLCVWPEFGPEMMEWNRCVWRGGLSFVHTTARDLTKHIRSYFDTTTGSKTDAQSYQKTADALQRSLAEIAFISDVAAELDAAQLAGMNVFPA